MIQSAINIYGRIGKEWSLWALILTLLLNLTCLKTAGQCDLLVVPIRISEISCAGGSDGLIEIGVYGGTPPYSFQWSNGGDSSIIQNLQSGEYSVSIIDAQGCDTVVQYILNDPEKLNLVLDKKNISCEGDTGLVIINCSGGTPPYEFRIDQGTPYLFDGVAYVAVDSGNYIVQVRDLNNCTAEDSINISKLEGLTIRVDSLKHVSCHGESDGYLKVTVSGGTIPFHFDWINQNVYQPEINNLRAGNYILLVSDHNNCLASVNIIIDEPDSTFIKVKPGSPFLIFGDSLILQTEIYTNAPPVTYNWYPDIGLSCIDCKTPKASPPSDTTYYVTMTDANGCMAFDTVRVDVVLEDLMLPNAFTPNGDGLNDYFRICGFLEEISFYRLYIYNRYGQMLAEIEDPVLGWDGKINGRSCVDDLYLWKLVFESNESPIINGRVVKSGTVMVLK